MNKEVSINKNTTAFNSEMNKNTNTQECRACLQPTGSKTIYNLFESWVTPWAVRGAIIADDLSKFADVEISEFDNYPKVICAKCYGRLSDACTFMITVQMSDSILRQRVENNITACEVTSWPQPILLNKSGNGEVDNRLEVEVKQEVLSEDDNGVENGADMDQDWEPMMDIKIEPEEISAPVRSNVQVNGVPDKTSDESTNSVDITNSNNKYNQDVHLDKAIKQEPTSGDELLEAVPDLPLDCMLCFKVFNTVSGLKAHVISQHSYKSVKRKATGCPSPVKNKIPVKEYPCDACDQSFTTSTDLMVHRAGHSGHVCYACDRKFGSFQQLSRHGPRCQKKHRRDHTRPPARPQQLLQSVKKSIKAPKQPTSSKQVTKELLHYVKNIIKAHTLPTKIEEPTPPLLQPVKNTVKEQKQATAMGEVIQELLQPEKKSIKEQDQATETVEIKQELLRPEKNTRKEQQQATATGEITQQLLQSVENTVKEQKQATAVGKITEKPVTDTVKEQELPTNMEKITQESLQLAPYTIKQKQPTMMEEMLELSQPVKSTIKVENQLMEEIVIKSESPAIEDTIAERVQELVNTWPSTEEMDMDIDIELSNIQSENKLEDAPQIGVKEQENIDAIKGSYDEKDLENKLAAIFDDPCLTSEQETSKIEIKNVIETIQEPVQEPEFSSSKVKIEQSYQKIDESSTPESHEPESKETKVEVQHGAKIKPIEEIQTELILEFKIKSPEKSLKTNLSQKTDERYENTPSESPEGTISNSLEIENQDELGSKTLPETQLENSSQSDVVYNLSNHDNSEEILMNISSESLEEAVTHRDSHNLSTVQEIEPSIQQNYDLENSTKLNEVKTDAPEETTSLSEMKVHLAINPLDKETVLFEAETKCLERRETKSCEPK